MRVLVAGAGGQLGRDLVEVFGRGHEVAALRRERMDVGDPEAIERAMEANRPQVVLNASVFANVDGCERDPQGAVRVNAEGPMWLARACRRHDALFVHFSTDYVFDGALGRPYAEGDPVHPLGAYAASKLEGEKRVEAEGGPWIILRTAWVFGPRGGGRPNFVQTILKLARDRGEVGVVEQRGSPTYTRDLAEATQALVERGGRGLFHAANEGTPTREEFVREILRLARVEARVVPTTWQTLGGVARRPPYSGMDASRLAAAVGRRMRPWREALRDYLESLGGTSPL